MSDFISVGNISVDLFFKGNSLTYKDNRFQLAIGGKYFTDYFRESLGGGGANVAIGAAVNGLNSSVFGLIGDNSFKELIIEKLKSKGVNINLCPVISDYINISTILLSPKGERSIIHFSNPHQHLFKYQSSVNQLAKSQMVYFGNLTDISLSEKINIMSLLKKNNVISVVNLGINDCRRPKHQLKELLEKVDILIINGYEFSEMVKASYKDIHFKENVIHWYLPVMKSKKVIITEGSGGSYGYFLNNVYHQPAVKVDKVIDATGAGDGYTAGFIADYFINQNIEQAMFKGAKYASVILQKVGAN